MEQKKKLQNIKSQIDFCDGYNKAAKDFIRCMKEADDHDILIKKIGELIEKNRDKQKEISRELDIFMLMNE